MEKFISSNKIPKLIHYCWFGNGPFSELMLKCMNSWKTYLPEYKIMIWNEESFDVNSNLFVKQAYESKKYAFVSDYVRLFVLYKYGGIYMDTDVEIVKPLDCFLDHDAFTGFENKVNIPTGIMGAKAKNEIIKSLLDYYKDKQFIKEDGKLDTTTNVKIITDFCLKHGFEPNNKYQNFKGLTLYPQTYFCPLSWNSEETDFSAHTYAIHHFSGSWRSDKDKRKLKRRKSRLWKTSLKLALACSQLIKFVIGESAYKRFKDFLSIKIE